MVSTLAPNETETVSRETLERYWDEVISAHGPARTIGVNMMAPFGDRQSLSTNSLMVFLPLYLVTSFLNCRGCGSCCKPNARKWDKGIILTREEILTLRQHANITKRNGHYMMKYPCPLLKNDSCRQYSLRPVACRLFPFNVSHDKKTKQYRHGIIMTCPAGKEFYVTIQLFLQELGRYLVECWRIGKQTFNIPDLETVKLKFEHNQIGQKDLVYMKRLAMKPQLAL